MGTQIGIPKEHTEAFVLVIKTKTHAGVPFLFRPAAVVALRRHEAGEFGSPATVDLLFENGEEETVLDAIPGMQFTVTELWCMACEGIKL